MKLQKYMFLLPRAIELASSRLGVRTIRMSEAFILYSSDYLPQATYSSLVRHGKNFGYPISLPTIAQGLRFLVASELLSNDNGVYSLTWKGREFLSRIRRYMLNARL